VALKHHHRECNVDFSIIERKAGAVKLANVGVIAEIGCARRQHLWRDIAAHPTTGNVRVQRTQVPPEPGPSSKADSPKPSGGASS
jgi:hypothetical protein